MRERGAEVREWLTLVFDLSGQMIQSAGGV